MHRPIKNSRLKTEGNEKGVEDLRSFHFQSNHDSDRSVDVVRIADATKTVKAKCKVTSEAPLKK